MINMPKSYWGLSPRDFHLWDDERQLEWLRGFRKKRREAQAARRNRLKKDDPEFLKREREKARAYREQNRERVREYNRAYQEKHRAEALQKKFDALPEEQKASYRRMEKIAKEHRKKNPIPDLADQLPPES